MNTLLYFYQQQKCTNGYFMLDQQSLNKNISKIKIKNNDLYFKQEKPFNDFFKKYYIYENILSIILNKSNKSYLFKDIYKKYNLQNLYTISINKIKQIGYLHKLFYFNFMDKHHELFVEYFSSFIPIFIKGEYDYCWDKNNCKKYIIGNKFNYMNEYIKQYKKQTKCEIKHFENKLKQLKINKLYSDN